MMQKWSFEESEFLKKQDQVSVTLLHSMCNIYISWLFARNNKFLKKKVGKKNLKIFAHPGIQTRTLKITQPWHYRYATSAWQSFHFRTANKTHPWRLHAQRLTFFCFLVFFTFYFAPLLRMRRVFPIYSQPESERKDVTHQKLPMKIQWENKYGIMCGIFEHFP